MTLKIDILWVYTVEDNIEVEGVKIYELNGKRKKLLLQSKFSGLMSFEFYGLCKNIEKLQETHKNKTIENLLNWISSNIIIMGN